MPVLPCGLNFNHMSTARALLPFESTSLGTRQALEHFVIYLPACFPPVFLFHISKIHGTRSLWDGIAGTISTSPNPPRLCCRARSFTYAELPDPPGLGLNLKQGLPYSKTFHYQLSLRASQRSLLCEAVSRSHLHTCSNFPIIIWIF